MSVMFGDYLQNRRIDRGYTLRRFCEENKLSPVILAGSKTAIPVHQILTMS